MFGSVTLDLDLVDRARSTVGGGYFLAGWVRRGPLTRVAQGGLVGIDYGMSEFVRRPRFRFQTMSVEPIRNDCKPLCSTIEKGLKILFWCGTSYRLATARVKTAGNQCWSPAAWKRNGPGPTDTSLSFSQATKIG
ncbi:hypothetical protein M9H77_16455 [Catharanthus roseus]|uniref:Uncharacterized protein n=1 Tax=Catharanthus roseus TaxID=4058 RepID=A0ACC0B1U2_CATRO|nr:hypothetical protein M9H77_16455 [Catharanthus roseus]